MHTLSFLIEATTDSKLITQALPALILIASGLHLGKLQIKKQRQKLKWQFLRFQLKHWRKAKRDKTNGAMIFLLILMLIACVAILWVLWALGGIFALVLGIVFGVGILTLILRD